MRVPSVDRPLEDAEWRQFLDDTRFGHLVASGLRDPVIVPTPFFLEGDVVYAHVAKDSPILVALAARERAVLAVAGDVAFVPSAWKAIHGEDPLLGIPTTYFAAVQLAGRTRLVEEPEALAALLRRQLAAFQPDIEAADPLAAHGRRLGSICGIVLEVEDVQARFKFGGNVDEAHRRAVLALLEERDLPGDRSAAEHLRRRVHAPRGTAFRR